jgi:hypothetical protein
MLEKRRVRSVHSVVFVSPQHEKSRNLRFHLEVGLIASDLVDAVCGWKADGWQRERQGYIEDLRPEGPAKQSLPSTRVRRRKVQNPLLGRDQNKTALQRRCEY